MVFEENYLPPTELNMQFMSCCLKRISLLQCIFNKQCSVYSIFCAVFHFKHGRSVYTVRCLLIWIDCLVKQELNLFIQARN